MHGASISHRGIRALNMRFECIRMVLKYLTGYEDHNRCNYGVLDGASISHRERRTLFGCVYGVVGLCFNISQGKKIIIDAFSVY